MVKQTCERRNSYNLIKSRGVVPANLKTRITENISCVIGATLKINQQGVQ